MKISPAATQIMAKQPAALCRHRFGHLLGYQRQEIGH